MANDLAQLDGGVMVRDEWTDARKELVKQMYCKGASELEFDVFVETCRRTGLSPLMKQIYCIMRSVQGKEVMTIQVAIDGFRLIADRTGCYVPGREATYTYDEKGQIATATAYVKKLVGGAWHEIAATVRWEEFQGTSNFWRSMPHHQLGKVAEAHALRRAFPADLSGLYTTDEMEQADRQSARGENTNFNRFTSRVSEESAPALPPGAKVPIPESEAYSCAICKAALTQAQSRLSIKAFDRPLCPTHQREQNRVATEAPRAPAAAASQRAREQAAPTAPEAAGDPFAEETPDPLAQAIADYAALGIRAKKVGVAKPALSREMTEEEVREMYTILLPRVEAAEAAAAQPAEEATA